MEIDSSADVKTVATIANQISYQNKGANRGRGLSAYTMSSAVGAASKRRCMLACERKHGQGALDDGWERFYVHLGIFRRRVARGDDSRGVRGARDESDRARDVRGAVPRPVAFD